MCIKKTALGEPKLGAASRDSLVIQSTFRKHMFNADLSGSLWVSSVDTMSLAGLPVSKFLYIQSDDVVIARRN